MHCADFIHSYGIRNNITQSYLVWSWFCCQQLVNKAHTLLFLAIKIYKWPYLLVNVYGQCALMIIGKSPEEYHKINEEFDITIRFEYIKKNLSIKDP